MYISIVGSGYVGLVAGACLAKLGHLVTCIDRDAKKIEQLCAGRLPIYEPGLDEIVVEAMKEGTLAFSTDLARAAAKSDAVFIAVGTPEGSDGRPDLTSVFGVAREIAASATRFTVVITKSTVPVGTGDAIEKVMREVAPEGNFAVTSNPEFLREGRAVNDFFRPDRIVIGAESAKACAVVAAIYGSHRFTGVPMLCTTRRSAELMKYACNAFLAAKIAFINDISDLCENARANVADVARGMGLDARIGQEFMQPGPGFGGSCLPKDTRALVAMAQDYEAPSAMFEAIDIANRDRKSRLGDRIVRACDNSVKGKTIAILGLTFKANTDDMRESPALPLIEYLKSEGARIRVYDPAGMHNAARTINDVVFANDPFDCAKGANCVVIATDWSEFRNLNLQLLKAKVAEPVMLDLRNVFDPHEMKCSGFIYVSLGRPAILTDVRFVDRELSAPAAKRASRTIKRVARANGRPLLA